MAFYIGEGSYVFAGVKQNVLCTALASETSQPIKYIDVDSELVRNFNRIIPRYDIREKFRQWVKDSQTNGVTTSASSGVIPLDYEYDLTYEKVNGRIRILNVVPHVDMVPDILVKIIESFKPKILDELEAPILKSYREWWELVETFGLFEVRNNFGGSYHDEGLQGDRVGQRSVRLSQAWRVIYRQISDSEIEVLTITKHKYNK